MPAKTSRLLAVLENKSLRLVLAESCTAGLLAGAIASTPGASRVLWGSFVSYTVDAKMKMLGIEKGLLEKHGSVSEACAKAMARGACEKSGAGLGLAVTGLAGPDGDGSGLPIGTVWIACYHAGKCEARLFNYSGGRNKIRQSAALDAVKELLKFIEAF